MSDTAPRTPVAVKPWVIPLLTGVIGLLLGSLITVGVFSIASAKHTSPNKGTAASPAAIKAADAKYDNALFTCSVQTSESLVINRKAAILRIHGASADGAVPGVSRDLATCVVNALGASPATIDQIDAHDAGIEKHTSTFNGLRLVWLGGDAGDVGLLVTPDTAQ